MRLWLSPRGKRGVLTLVVTYTIVVGLTGFFFCTLFYCRNCQMGTMTRDELAAKLAAAARRLGFEDNREEKESMPKPPESIEAFGGRGRIHAYVSWGPWLWWLGSKSWTHYSYTCIVLYSCSVDNDRFKTS